MYKNLDYDTLGKLIIIIILIVVTYILIYKNSNESFEHLVSLSNESLQTIADVYNSSNLQTTGLTVTNDLDVANNATIRNGLRTSLIQNKPDEDMLIKGYKKINIESTDGVTINKSDDSNGNLVIKGDLTVDGNINGVMPNADITLPDSSDKNFIFTNDLRVNGNITANLIKAPEGEEENLQLKGNLVNVFSKDKTIIAKTGEGSGDLLVEGNLMVNGTVSANGTGTTFGGSGSGVITSFENNFTFKKDLKIDGKTVIDGDVRAERNAYVKNDFNVANNSTLTGTVNVGKNINVTGDVRADKKLYVKDSSDFAGFVTARKGANIIGDTNIMSGDLNIRRATSGSTGNQGGDLLIEGNSNFKGKITARDSVNLLEDVNAMKNLTVGNKLKGNMILDGTIQKRYSGWKANNGSDILQINNTSVDDCANKCKGVENCTQALFKNNTCWCKANIGMHKDTNSTKIKIF